jgi:SAM-dependent methyltransferase
MATPVKVYKNKRLLCYATEPDGSYWDSVWEDSISLEYYAKYIQGYLDEFGPFFERYLPKGEPIIEAGCGNGRYVLALKKRGYLIEGIEWGKKTVANVKNLFPDLPISVGDVTHLDVPDNHYGGYISLGVIEHREKGPEPFLVEARRILKPGSTCLISVPFMNPFRKFKGALGFYEESINSEQVFYQYIDNKKTIEGYLSKAGFEIVNRQLLAGYHGLKDEIPGLFEWLPKIRGGYRMMKILKRIRLNSLFGHVVLYVCKNP